MLSEQHCQSPSTGPRRSPDVCTVGQSSHCSSREHLQLLRNSLPWASRDESPGPFNPVNVVVTSFPGSDRIQLYLAFSDPVCHNSSSPEAFPLCPGAQGHSTGFCILTLFHKCSLLLTLSGALVSGYCFLCNPLKK